MRFRPFCLAVALASAATIGLELTLTRIFSVTLYYHFAFMVISVAMLGLSVAGVVLYLAPRLFEERRAPVQAAVFMVLFALLAVLTLKVAIDNPVTLAAWRDNLGRLAALYIATGATMLCSGFAISLAIASARERIGKVYAFDLVGAAVGCAAVIPAVASLTGPGAVLFCAALGAASAALFAFSAEKSRPGTRISLLSVASLLTVGVLALSLGEGGAGHFGRARNPSKFLGDRPVEFEKWNSFSQITVAPAGAADHKWIFIDADAATRIWSGSIKAAGWQAPRRYGEVRVASLAYAIRSSGTALIIGPGGGTDVISALHHGVPRVVGVEVNPIIVNDVTLGRYAAFAGDLYREPRVQVVVDEGRSYIRRSVEPYQSIQATLVDTWAASSSGAFTLSENNIYTVEAFEEFFAHLAPGGVVTVTRWYDADRPKEFLRLVALARAALEKRGVAPTRVQEHFVLAADKERRGTLLVSRDPFSSDDRARLAAKVREGDLVLLFSPGVRAEGSDAEDALLAGYLRAADSQAFLARLSFDASPTTDDRPFFFYNLRRADLLSILERLGSLELNNLGVAILLLLLVAGTLLTLLLVLLPLFIFERRALREDRRIKLRVLGYFVSLGLGFILVEIGFMQTFVLFLGHPIYALAVVLASLLLASGIGSALSTPLDRRFGARGLARRVIAVLALLLVAYGFVLNPIFHALLGIPLSARIAVTALLVAAPGVLMGMLLPSGVRVAQSLGAGVVPWAWGLNGAAGVVGSVLAVALSMNVGFRLALFCGIGVYLLGLWLMPRPRAPAPA